MLQFLKSEKKMLTVALSVGVLIISIPGTALAAVETGGYPDANAAACPHFGAWSWCKDNNNNGRYDGLDWASSRGYAYRNCTDFVAWKLKDANDFKMPGAKGDAFRWGEWANDQKYDVNLIPAVGSVAWWDANKDGRSSAGHVAWVSGIHQDGKVRIQQYNGDNSGNFSEVTIASSSPSGYIHFKDLPSQVTQVQAQNMLVARVGGVLYGKASLNDQWSTLMAGGATSNYKVAGDRFVMVDAGGQLIGKQGLHGQWQTLTQGVDDYWLTPSMLVIRVGSTLWAKGNLNDSWAHLTSGATSDMKVDGSRIAFMSGGTLIVKDGIHGEWTHQIQGLDEYQISSSLLVVRIGSELWAKAGLHDQWSKLTTGATQGFVVSGQRIAFVSGGTLLTKEGIHGQWQEQLNGFDEYDLSESLLTVRVGGTLYAKAQLNDQWSTLTHGATPDVKVKGNRIGLVNGGTLTTKEGIHGLWATQIGAQDDFAF